METVVSTSHQGRRPIANGFPVHCGLHAADLASSPGSRKVRSKLSLPWTISSTRPRIDLRDPLGRI
jgi:hypothetical protein